MSLTGPSGAVAGTTAYDAATTTATFTPTAALATRPRYTATVSGATDAANNEMAPVSWSFTTGGTAAAAARPGTRRPGTGGQELGAGREPFTPFTAEILRTEGLNEFATADCPR